MALRHGHVYLAALGVADAVGDTFPNGGGHQPLRRGFRGNVAGKRHLDTHLRGFPFRVCHGALNGGTAGGERPHGFSQAFQLLLDLQGGAVFHVRHRQQAAAQGVVEPDFQIQALLFPHIVRHALVHLLELLVDLLQLRVARPEAEGSVVQLCLIVGGQLGVAPQLLAVEFAAPEPVYLAVREPVAAGDIRQRGDAAPPGKIRKGRRQVVQDLGVSAGELVGQGIHLAVAENDMSIIIREAKPHGEVIHGLLDRPLVDLLLAPPVLPVKADAGVEVDAHNGRRQGQIGQMNVGMGDPPVIAHHEPHQPQQGEQQRGVGHGAPFRMPVGRTEYQQGDLRQATQPRQDNQCDLCGVG